MTINNDDRDVKLLNLPRVIGVKNEKRRLDKKKRVKEKFKANIEDSKQFENGI